MKVVFISNYINHHQIPFCDAMSRELEGQFVFVQTVEMEAERVAMGWNDKELPEYVHCYYREEELCKEWIAQADVVLFGGTGDESYIEDRLKNKKPVIRVDERLYKEGQWKAVSPRGLYRKYLDHVRYRKAPVYFLCAGAYVASDLSLIHAYPGKKFCWGYFPPMRTYDVDNLLKKKETDSVRILWAARFIDWKHGDYPVRVAKYLKEKGIAFHLDMIGGGEKEEEIRSLVEEYGVSDRVTLLGYQPPETVRDYMERASVFLMTSDRNEGWGAVANEAMNSGCALVADHMTGAAPFLIRHGENGYVYESGNVEMLMQTVEKLVLDTALCKRIGRNAYETVTRCWNGENAAKQLLCLIRETVLPGKTCFCKEEGQGFSPCAPAPAISEKKMFGYLTKGR